MLSISQKEVTLQQAGSINQVGHWKPGYNKSSQIRTLTLTWSGCKSMIILYGDRCNPLWSGAAVSEWVMSGCGTTNMSFHYFSTLLAACYFCHFHSIHLLTSFMSFIAVCRGLTMQPCSAVQAGWSSWWRGKWLLEWKWGHVRHCLL